MYFPTWRYHRTEQPVVVHSPAELEALGEGWADTPAAFDVEPAKPNALVELPALLSQPNTRETAAQTRPTRRKKAE